MAITISGTTGIAGVDGSAGTPAVQGADTNTGIFFPAADTIAFAEGGTEVARFDSSGNLLVNTTTAQTGAKLAVTGGIQGTITSSTAVVNPTSPASASIDFTGIPSWVKRITVMFNGVSTNGTSNPLIQLGDAGGIETTGYLGSSVDSFAPASSNYTTGIGIISSLGGNVLHGSIVISLVGSNAWVASYVLVNSANANGFYGGGSKTLSDTLTQVRITTVGGINTFDAGTINILYEG
jgi:hypothetical protein